MQYKLFDTHFAYGCLQLDQNETNLQHESKPLSQIEISE